MLYDRTNTLPKTTVHDLDRREIVRDILSIDTDKGEVVAMLRPLRVAADRETILTQTIRFAAIWPILDQGAPCAFHCHGRQD